MLDKVGLFQVNPLHTFATTLLLTIRSHRKTLHVACLGYGNGNLFFSDEVFYIKILRLVGNLGNTSRAVLFLDFSKLFLDYLLHQVFVRKQALVVVDLFAQLLQFGFDLLSFQAGQTAQLHFENGFALLFGKLKALHQHVFRFAIGVGRADDLDYLIDVVEGNYEALQNMCASLRFGQVVARTTLHNLFLMQDVIVENFLQGQHARNTVNQRQHVAAKANLQLGVLIQLVEHNLRDSILLQLDNDIDAMAVGAVMNV